MHSKTCFRIISISLLCSMAISPVAARDARDDPTISLNYHLTDDNTFIDTSQTARYFASSLYTGVRISITDKNTGLSTFSKDVTSGSLLYPFDSPESKKSQIKSNADSFIEQLSSELSQPDLKNSLIKMAQRNTNLELRVTPIRRLVGSGEDTLMDVYDFISYCFPGATYKTNVDDPKTLWDRLMTEYGKTPSDFGNWTDNGSLAYAMGGFLGVYYNEAGDKVSYPEWSTLSGAFTIPLLELLGVIPPVQNPADTAEEHETSSLHWKSVPKAYAELKQGTYSANRVTEEWEAMAGVPHTEKLYYDAGASTVSADLIASGPETYHVNLPQPPTPIASHTPTTVTVNSHPHSTDSECTRCHHWSHTTMNCSTKDCNTTYHTSCVDEREHSSIHVVWEIPDITDYYPMDAWSITFPASLSQDLNGISEDLSISCPGLGSVSWDGTVGFENQMSFPSVMNSYSCECSKGCRAYASDVLNDLRDHSDKDHPVAIFHVQKLLIQDRDNNQYPVLYPDDIYFYVESVSGSPSDCGVTFKVTLAMESSLTGRVATASSGEVSYSSDMSGIHDLDMCNFLPVEESWGTDDHFSICGYNGEFTTPKRRDSTCGHDHFFYRDSLPITDISNGEKSAGVGTVSYIEPKTYGSGAFADTTVQTTYSDSDTGVNDIIIHTPVSLSSFRIQPVMQPYDQRVQSLAHRYEDVYLTPSLPFIATSEYMWESEVQESTRGLSDTTVKTGNGYYHNRDTESWVAEKWYSFAFEVLYKDHRYAANEWIQIPVNEKSSRFTLPLSEEEVSGADARAVILATNSEFRGNPNAAWEEQSRVYNKRPDSLRAPSSAYLTKSLDIVGRIGNMVISYVPDPNWSSFFRAPTTGWQITDVLPNVDLNVPRYYLGPYHDIYDMRYWIGEGDTLKETTSFGLNAYGTLPQLSRGHLGSVLPLSAGKNITHAVLKKEPAKVGYPVWWSIQTIGNYSEGASLEAYPEFKLYDPATNSAQPVDLWAKVGSVYKRIYDSTNHLDDPIYSWDLTTKLTHTERAIGELEKSATQSVIGSAYNELFNPALVRNLGTLNKITLTDEVKTYVGSTSFMGESVIPNASPHSNEAQHAKQAQRWHGTLMLPSSLQISLPNQKDFVDCSNKYLLVNISFKTNNAVPWTLSTEDTLALGSNSDGERSWFQTPDENLINLIGSDCIIVYELNKTSDRDLTVRGTF